MIEQIAKNDGEEPIISQKGETRKQRRAIKRAQTVLEKNSFSVMLIKTFAVFSLIIVAAVSAVFAIFNWFSKQEVFGQSGATIEAYKTQLENGKYSEINAKRTFGEEGWLEIVSATPLAGTTNCHVVYSSLSLPNTYTLGELDCIQFFGDATSITSHSFETVSGQQHYLVTRTTVVDGEVQEDYVLLAPNALDHTLRVVSGNISTSKTKYTQREYELLVFNQYGETVIEKYAFQDKNGSAYYAVYYDTNNNLSVVYDFIMAISVLIAFAVCVVIMLFFIRYLNKNVQKPLANLRTAMTQFSTGRYRDKIEYKGALEFEQLSGSFNEMVDLLTAEQTKREQAEKDKQRMLAGLSHDLKTPITVMQGFAEAIRDGLVSEEDKQKYLNLIVDKSTQMNNLIAMFYEYSKLEHPDFTYNKEEIDIAELVRVGLAKRYDELDINGYKLEADITEDSLLCNADYAQLARVFNNLFTNFLKYTPKGSTLYVWGYRDGDNAVFEVGDNGNGIDENAIDDIFKPFEVGEKSRNNQGSGLGLAVCEKIIMAHGGSICVSKNAHKECNLQFDIVLPLASSQESYGVKEGDDE